MIDPQLTQFFVSLGVGGVLAGVIFFFYRKDMAENRTILKEIMDGNQIMRSKVIDLIEKCITCITANSELMRDFKGKDK